MKIWFFFDIKVHKISFPAWEAWAIPKMASSTKWDLSEWYSQNWHLGQKKPAYTTPFTIASSPLHNKTLVIKWTNPRFSLR